MTMGTHSFNIPTIPGDLRREETIHHIADALEYLDKVAEDVFTRISKRVAENKTHLQKINDRVNLAAARVDKLKGSNKATKVFACAKYPSENKLESFKQVFAETDGLQNPKHSHFKVQEKHPVVDERVLREKLQFYNVHLNTKAKKNAQRDEGLGGLPSDIPSISSLLLFNTTENPYKKYVIIDPLGVVTKTRAALEEEETGMAEAPSTILHNEEMFHLPPENILYQPELGAVPEIVVPDQIPNLPGVADDESFSADQGPSIAPSVMGSLMPDLPEVTPEQGSVLPPPQSAPDNLPSIGGSSSNSTAAAAPPPPPPPPPPSADAAPPPPPPPPPPPDAPAPPPPPPPTDVPAAVSNPSSGRDNLLDAIRKAGGASGAGLKSAKNTKMSNKKKKKEEKDQGAAAPSGGGGGGGDLMGDLFARISMRRKGISGTKTGGDKQSASADSSSSPAAPPPAAGSGGAMDRISSMIPPPPKGADAGSDGSDDNWE